LLTKWQLNHSFERVADQMAIEGPKIVIEGYPNEEVILDGTVAINAQWQAYPHNGHNIYKTVLDMDNISKQINKPVDNITGVFVNGRYMIPAMPMNFKNPTDNTTGNPKNREPGTVWAGIGKSPSKLDMSRILSMNEHYIKNMNENDLFDHLIKYFESYKDKIDNKGKKIKKSLSFLKNKAKTLEDIYNNAQYIIKDKIQISTEDIKLLDNLSKTILKDFLKEFEKLSNINKENLEKIINDLIKNNKTNFKGVGQPLRIALVGSKFGPGIYDIILSLDKNEVVQRLKAAN